jgi:hypothetical protein
MKVNNPTEKFSSITNISLLSIHNFNCIPFLFNNNNNKLQKITKATILNFLLSFILVFFMLGVFTHTVQAEPLRVINIVEGDVWRYFKGEKNPKSKWNHIGFFDSKWLKGPSGFGYGDSNYNTVLHDMQGNYVCIYVRREFIVDNPAAIKEMTLTIICDGPFMAYINGIEVIRSKVKVTEQLDISGFAHELLPGTNVLGIQGFNDDINSSSFSFIPLFKIVEE